MSPARIDAEKLPYQCSSSWMKMLDVRRGESVLLYSHGWFIDCHQEMLMGLYSFNPTATFLERKDLNSGYNSNVSVSSLSCKLFALT